MNKKLLKELIEVWKDNVKTYLEEGSIKQMQDEIDVTILTLKFNKEAGLKLASREAAELLGERLIEQIANCGKDLLDEFLDRGLMLDFHEHYPEETLDAQEIFEFLSSECKTIEKYLPGLRSLIEQYDQWENEIASPELYKYVERN